MNGVKCTTKGSHTFYTFQHAKNLDTVKAYQAAFCVEHKHTCASVCFLMYLYTDADTRQPEEPTHLWPVSGKNIETRNGSDSLVTLAIIDFPMLKTTSGINIF